MKTVTNLNKNLFLKIQNERKIQFDRNKLFYMEYIQHSPWTQVQFKSDVYIHLNQNISFQSYPIPNI